MQTNQPDFEQLLNDWVSLALENPLFVAAIAVSVLLLMVLFYTVRIAILNKKRRILEQEGIKLRGLLEEAELQITQGDEKLTVMTEQLENEQQQAAENTAKVEERNQTIIENIKQLAQKFNLSEQLVASDTKPKVEFIWQQQDNIQMQLGDRLQAESQEKNTLKNTYNQEKERFSKQKVLVEQLQKTLDIQTSKSEQLVRDLGAQKLLLEQHKTQAEQKLADIQAKHELGVASLADELELQKERLVSVTEEQQVAVTEILSEVAAETIEEVIQVQKQDSDDQQQEVKNSVEPEVVVNEIPEKEVNSVATKQILPTVVEEPEAEGVEQDDPDYTQSNLDIAGKFKSLFSKGKEKAQETKVSAQELEEQILEVAEPEAVEPVLESESEPDYKQSSLDMGGKLKSLNPFSKSNKQEDTVEVGSQPEPVEPEEPTAEPEELENEPDFNQPSQGIGGKLKSLNPFARSNQHEDTVEAESQPKSVEPEELESEPDYNQSSRGVGGKLKGLNPFAKSKEKTEAVESVVQQAEELVSELTEPVAEIADPVEEQVFEPDYAESNFKVPAKLKGLFGKG